jgi:hypothetical protein
MNSNRHFSKSIAPDLGGNPATGAARSGAANSTELPEELLIEDAQPLELYLETQPSPPKKHSADFILNRRKVRQIAAAKLPQLSEQLFKLADELRYYDPLMAEVLDDACSATEEALTLMQNQD